MLHLLFLPSVSWLLPLLLLMHCLLLPLLDLFFYSFTYSWWNVAFATVAYTDWSHNWFCFCPNNLSSTTATLWLDRFGLNLAFSSSPPPIHDFWDQLMMKGLRSIFKVTFLPPLFQFISSWWGRNQCFSLGPHHQQFVFAKRADRFSVDNCRQIWPEFRVASISSILQTSGMLMCLSSPIEILKSKDSPFCAW